MIRTDMQRIRKGGRNTSGGKVVSVEGKDRVVSIAKCPKEDIQDTEDLDKLDETGMVNE
jgi:DNA gyrase subunit A